MKYDELLDLVEEMNKEANAPEANPERTYRIYDPETKTWLDDLLGRPGKQVGTQTVGQAAAQTIAPMAKQPSSLLGRVVRGGFRQIPGILAGTALGAAGTMGSLYYDAYRTPQQYWEGAY